MLKSYSSEIYLSGAYQDQSCFIFWPSKAIYTKVYMSNVNQRRNAMWKTITSAVHQRMPGFVTSQDMGYSSLRCPNGVRKIQVFTIMVEIDTIHKRGIFPYRNPSITSQLNQVSIDMPSYHLTFRTYISSKLMNGQFF